MFNAGRGASLSVWELRPDETAPEPGTEGTFPIFDAVDARAQRHELILRGVRTSRVRETAGARCFSMWDLDGNRLEACEVIEPGA